MDYLFLLRNFLQCVILEADKLCDYLDVKAKQLILKNYKYDVNKDIR